MTRLGCRILRVEVVVRFGFVMGSYPKKYLTDANFSLLRRRGIVCAIGSLTRRWIYDVNDDESNRVGEFSVARFHRTVSSWGEIASPFPSFLFPLSASLSPLSNSCTYCSLCASPGDLTAQRVIHAERSSVVYKITG